MRCELAVAFTLIGGSMAQSQERELKAAIGQCATVHVADDRLACFDSLAHGVAEAAKNGEQPHGVMVPGLPTPGTWRLQAGQDPLDDSRTVLLGLTGNENKAELALRCRQKRLDVIVSWGGRFIGASGPTVWTRVGSAKAEKRRWVLSSDRKAALFEGDAKQFIRQLLSADRLVIQTDDFVEGRITEVFDVSGLRQKSDVLRQECLLE